MLNRGTCIDNVIVVIVIDNDIIINICSIIIITIAVLVSISKLNQLKISTMKTIKISITHQSKDVFDMFINTIQLDNI